MAKVNFSSSHSLCTEFKICPNHRGEHLLRSGLTDFVTSPGSRVSSTYTHINIYIYIYIYN